MPSITGLVLTYNGERLLDKCLASLSFCDKIIVVDSFSTDETLSIAEKYKATILQNPWDGFKSQFEFGLKHIESEWVISLDQDEICSTKLKEEILKELDKTDSSTTAFRPRRRNWYYDRFMKHSGWYPDRLIRIFRPEYLTVTQSGSHESFKASGTVKDIDADILHYPYESFSHHLSKINLYAQEGADDLKRKHRKGGITVALAHAIMRFIKIYFFKLGMLDGKAGFINAMHGFFYVFLKYVRINEGDWGTPFDSE
ncbi:Glycosyltransferase involved in cell wall bisynthesis [Halodesulfovibrio marinisediminis DSM 17456]|uniref:Glycosyltransferase involved in cell wall bisynthesis n=2 Tax=Halodesulfovibrio marinisediminis TaxID=458711 RepID=A0A1N6HGR1_9BACT|nr:Glycosyltransferase involved in cell wall bisynthesis [Halodesulfovibrio marinisediminis DSM 17456]